MKHPRQTDSGSSQIILVVLYVAKLEFRVQIIQHNKGGIFI